MKNLFLLYACAEKFRAAKIGAINISLSPKASMAEFHAAKREDVMKFLEFFCKRAERGLEILKFLSARHFGSHKQVAEFLKFASEPPRNRYEILNFTLAPHKFKPVSAVRLNFALNSIPHARAIKFEHGVKFKGAAKFERGAR